MSAHVRQLSREVRRIVAAAGLEFGRATTHYVQVIDPTTGAVVARVTQNHNAARYLRDALRRRTA